MKKQVKISLPVSQIEELERRATTEQPISNLIERGAELLLAHFDAAPSPFAVFMRGDSRLPSLSRYAEEGKRQIRCCLPAEMVNRLDQIADSIALGSKRYLWPHAVEQLLVKVPAGEGVDVQ